PTATDTPMLTATTTAGDAALEPGPAPLVRSLAAPQAQCVCKAAGPYLDPATRKPSLSATFASPTGKFQASSAPPANGVTSLTITQNSATVLTISVPPDATNAGWGFSPDDDRFVIWYSSLGNIHAALYDLTSGSQSPIWTPSQVIPADQASQAAAA